MSGVPTIQAVINPYQMFISVSGIPLSDHCTSVLSRSSSFASTHSTGEFETKADLFRFYRNLHLKAWYCQNSEPRLHQSSKQPPALSDPKPTFLSINNNACLTTITKKVSHDVENFRSATGRPAESNLTRSEHQALQRLQDQDDQDKSTKTSY